MTPEIPPHARGRYRLAADPCGYHVALSLTETVFSDTEPPQEVERAYVMVDSRWLDRPPGTPSADVEAVVADLVRRADAQRPAGDPVGEAARAAIAVERLRRAHVRAPHAILIDYAPVAAYLGDIARAVADLGALGEVMADHMAELAGDAQADGERRGWRRAALHAADVRANAGQTARAADALAQAATGGKWITCGDCKAGRCHWGSEASAAGAAERGEPCGCARHEVSVFLAGVESAAPDAMLSGALDLIEDGRAGALADQLAAGYYRTSGLAPVRLPSIIPDPGETPPPDAVLLTHAVRMREILGNNRAAYTLAGGAVFDIPNGPIVHVPADADLAWIMLRLGLEPAPGAYENGEDTPTPPGPVMIIDDLPGPRRPLARVATYTLSAGPVTLSDVGARLVYAREIWRMFRANRAAIVAAGGAVWELPQGGAVWTPPAADWPYVRTQMRVPDATPEPESAAAVLSRHRDAAGAGDVRALGLRYVGGAELDPSTEGSENDR